jgi:microcin C transport system permease protein
MSRSIKKLRDKRRPLLELSPLNRRRLANFKANKRGLWSLHIFVTLVLLSFCAEFIANDKPLLIYYDGGVMSPVLSTYTDSDFGGEFVTEADYHDPLIQRNISEKGWALWPLIPYHYDTIVRSKTIPAPAPPDGGNWLGTDDHQRDVLARVIYGFRTSVIFALLLTAFSSLIGVTAGAVQGYFGGWTDLIFQRFIEIWSAIPALYVLIILAAVIQPSFWVLLAALLLFSWVALVGVVRAEFLRGRNFEYVRAAKALGVRDITIMTRHILPNAMVATITFMPFLLSGAITTLSSLDFLGFGLPPGSASLGELARQGKENLQAPWLGITAFAILASMLSLLVFIGEAARDAFDPRKADAAGDV